VAIATERRSRKRENRALPGGSRGCVRELKAMAVQAGCAEKRRKARLTAVQE